MQDDSNYGDGHLAPLPWAWPVHFRTEASIRSGIRTDVDGEVIDLLKYAVTAESVADAGQDLTALLNAVKQLWILTLTAVWQSARAVPVLPVHCWVSWFTAWVMQVVAVDRGFLVQASPAKVV